MKVVFVIIFFIAFIWLFYKAADGLKLTKLNAVSLAFYQLLFFEAIGGAIIFLGFRDHYLIQKIRFGDTYNLTFFLLAYSLIVMPTTIIFFTRWIKKRRPINTDINVVVTDYNDEVNRYYNVIKVLTIISIIACVYTFYTIGYVSLLRIILPNTGFNFSSSRILNGRGFEGNQYIRNLLFLELSPILSFASYIFYKVTKNTRWKLLFALNCIVTILAKTYDFAKSPVIIFLAMLYIINIHTEVDNKKAFKRLVILSLTIIGLLFMSYTIIGQYTGSKWLSLSSGPVSRLLITQVACLFLHVDCFPSVRSFLNGASFPSWIGTIFGFNNWGQRSGRVIAEIYNASAVANGTAGVNNTLFVGEAYANWGIVGALLAPIWVGIIFAILQNYSSNKTMKPFNLLVYMVVLNFINNSMEGGIVDFIYSSNFLFQMFVLIIISAAGNGWVIRIPLRKKR